MDEINPADKRLAKRLYLRYTPHEKICDVAKVNQRQLRRWVSEGWKKERERLEQRITDEVENASFEKLKQVHKLSCDMLSWGLTEKFKEWKSGETSPTIYEIKTVADIVSNVDRLNRLDAGKATDIHATVTPKEIMQVFINDPYMRLANPDEEEAEVLDVTDESRNSRLTSNSDRPEVSESSGAVQSAEQEV